MKVTMKIFNRESVRKCYFQTKKTVAGSRLANSQLIIKKLIDSKINNLVILS